MEPKTGQKPINVLTEFLTSWIRENSEEALPFDSFENLLPSSIAQKTVERWIFNCNYLYHRVGDLMYDHYLFPDDPTSRNALIADIDATFKSISAKTPLNLRAKTSDAIVYELSRDWPPFCHNSRNTLAKFESMIQAYSSHNPAFCADRALELDAIRTEIIEEAAFYSALSERTKASGPALATQCRALLPIWCAKEINPLMTLLIWNDEAAIAQLVDALASAFANSPGYHHTSETIDMWREATLWAQRSYIENIDDDIDLTLLRVAQIGELLAATGFSLDHSDRHAEVPRWLLGKSRLIWNIVMCSILGPAEAVGELGASRSSTAGRRMCAPVPAPTGMLAGEVLLRRRFASGEVRTVDSIDIDRLHAPGLWKILGSEYDACASLPNSQHRERLIAPGACFVQTRTRNANGIPVEGTGDSRFHLELDIVFDQQRRASIVARDLDSKNGTWVWRSGGPKNPGIYTCFVLAGRNALSAAEWSTRIGVPVARIELTRELTLERGDIIHLPGSCFELI
ncbi:MAG: hypothetical protein Q4B77_05235 [Coriobacteriaceae bacterium]|nr:hypothetical protein [Coriobacteriaceae bacterium]